MKIALGSVQFGLKYGISNLSGPTSKSQIKKILEIAKDLGVDIIDTATVYGNSELLLGNSNVKNFKVVTKIPTLKPNILNIEKWVNDKVYSSIKKLKIESLYGVLIHNSNNFFGDKGKILLEALQSLKKDGKIKKIGISIYDPLELNYIEDLNKLDLVQAPMNLIDRRLQKSGWLKKLQKNGVEIHVRSVFLQGLLLIKPNKIPTKFKKWNTILNQWHYQLEKKKINAIEACLSYPLSLPEVDKIIVGVNNIRQFREIITAYQKNLKFCDWSFMASNDQQLINPSNWSNF